MIRKLSLALAILTVAALPAQARSGGGFAGGRGGGHGGDHFGGGGHFGHFGGHERFEHFHDHFHRGFVGPGVFIGPDPFWYPWGYPYYGYPYYAPPVVSVPSPPAEVYVQPQPAPPAQSYWYYCASAGAYYPYVSGCPEAWMQVVPPAQ